VEEEFAMPAIPLPDRPSLEQLKKQARLLRGRDLRGTFAIPDLVGLNESSSSTHLVARDEAGNELERLPYRDSK
jgi:hypothetical protein